MDQALVPTRIASTGQAPEPVGQMPDSDALSRNGKGGMRAADLPVLSKFWLLDSVQKQNIWQTNL